MDDGAVAVGERDDVNVIMFLTLKFVPSKISKHCFFFCKWIVGKTIIIGDMVR